MQPASELPAEPAIVVNNVSKMFRLYHQKASSLKERVINLRSPKFEEFWALKDVSLQVNHGETFGLIGANGSGKSTLLKLIAGTIRPQSGEITTYGRIASLLELGAGFHPELTGRENVYLNASILGLTRKETDLHFDSIIDFSEIEQFIDMQVKHYSSGMFVRLGFAVAVHVDPEILLVDEVLAVGDEAFQRKCLDRIRTFQKEGRTIVFVSHGVDMVRNVCNRAAFLHHGQLMHMGPAAEVVTKYREVIHGETQAGTTDLVGEKGNKKARILSVSIKDGQGRDRQMFTAGEPMQVFIDIESSVPVEDPVVGLSIDDQMAQGMFGTNTERKGIRIDSINGKCRVVFSFEALPFQAETYLVSASIHSRDEETLYHWVDRAASFWCNNTGNDAGALNMPCDVTVEYL